MNNQTMCSVGESFIPYPKCTVGEVFKFTYPAEKVKGNFFSWGMGEFCARWKITQKLGICENYLNWKKSTLKGWETSFQCLSSKLKDNLSKYNFEHLSKVHQDSVTKFSNFKKFSEKSLAGIEEIWNQSVNCLEEKTVLGQLECKQKELSKKKERGEERVELKQSLSQIKEKLQETDLLREDELQKNSISRTEGINEALKKLSDVILRTSGSSFWIEDSWRCWGDCDKRVDFKENVWRLLSSPKDQKKWDLREKMANEVKFNFQPKELNFKSTSQNLLQAIDKLILAIETVENLELNESALNQEIKLEKSWLDFPKMVSILSRQREIKAKFLADKKHFTQHIDFLNDHIYEKEVKHDALDHSLNSKDRLLNLKKNPTETSQWLDWNKEIFQLHEKLMPIIKGNPELKTFIKESSSQTWFEETEKLQKLFSDVERIQKELVDLGESITGDLKFYIDSRRKLRNSYNIFRSSFSHSVRVLIKDFRWNAGRRPRPSQRKNRELYEELIGVLESIEKISDRQISDFFKTQDHLKKFISSQTWKPETLKKANEAHKEMREAWKNLIDEMSQLMKIFSEKVKTEKDLSIYMDKLKEFKTGLKPGLRPNPVVRLS